MRFIPPLAILLIALALGPTPSASAQDLPPGPATLQTLSRLPVAPALDRVEETQLLILEFAPGTWTLSTPTVAPPWSESWRVR